MLIDIDDLVSEGLDPAKMAGIADRALMGLNGCKSKEAEWLATALESLRDECEARDAA